MLPSEQEINPIRYCTTVMRRRWKLLAGSAGVGIVVGTAVAMLPPSYTAKSQIVVDAQAATVGSLIDDAAVDTRVEMLMSASHLRRVMQSLPTQNEEHDGVRTPVPSATDAPPLAQKRFLQRLRNVAETPSAASPAANPQARPDLSGIQLDDLERSVNVFKERRSRVIAVTYRSQDPAIAAALANRVVEIYVDGLRTQREKSRAATLERLEERIPAARSSMEEAERALRRFAMLHGFSGNGDLGDADARIAEINRQLATARSELAERQRALESATPGISSSTDGKALHTRMAAVTPTILDPRSLANRQSDDGGGTIPEPGATNRPLATHSLARDASVIEARVGYLERWQSRLQDARAQTLDAELAYRDLVRAAEFEAQQYDALRRRHSELLSDDAVQPDARILSLAAVPAKPSSPDPILFILPAAVFFLLVGALLALLLERGNRSLRSARALNDNGDVSDVVLFPRINRRQRRLLPCLQPSPASIDALRLVSAKSMTPRWGDDNTCTVLLVTSSVQGEGKTTLAISLSGYLRSLGRKVLLLDLDFRRPGLSTEFEPAAGSGLMDLLHGKPLTERIRRHDPTGMDYLPLPADRIDPLLVLTHRAFPALIADLRQRYELIVIDGSHMSGTPDADYLTGIADHAVLVSRWGKTSVDAARSALIRLRTLGWSEKERFCAVLTMVDMRRYRRQRFAEMN